MEMAFASPAIFCCMIVTNVSEPHFGFAACFFEQVFKINLTAFFRIERPEPPKGIFPSQGANHRPVYLNQRVSDRMRMPWIESRLFTERNLFKGSFSFTRMVWGCLDAVRMKRASLQPSLIRTGYVFSRFHNRESFCRGARWAQFGGGREKYLHALIRRRGDLARQAFVLDAFAGFRRCVLNLAFIQASASATMIRTRRAPTRR